jgi:hypothetical protein
MTTMRMDQGAEGLMKTVGGGRSAAQQDGDMPEMNDHRAQHRHGESFR